MRRPKGTNDCGKTWTLRADMRSITGGPHALHRGSHPGRAAGRRERGEGAHFIGLDSVDYDDLWYYGHVDDAQVAWLEQDLALVPDGTPVITFSHIPFFSGMLSVAGYDDTSAMPTLVRVNGVSLFRHGVSNARDVVRLLGERHAFTLAVGGHFHAREKLEYETDGDNVRYYQTAAVTGPGGGPDMQMTSGVTLYRVEDGRIDEGEFIPLDRPE